MTHNFSVGDQVLHGDEVVEQFQAIFNGSGGPENDGDLKPKESDYFLFRFSVVRKGAD